MTRLYRFLASRLLTNLLLAGLIAAILAGCVPKGVDLRTPLGSVDSEYEAEAEICTLRGELYMPQGASLTCGNAGEGAGPPPKQPPPPSPAPVTAPVTYDEPHDQPPPPTIADTIHAAEGGSNLAYCDDAGPHIGDGIHLSDAERSAALCQALEDARTEARRVLGAFAFSALDDVRRDVWVELCYWAPCAGFERAAQLIRAGNYAGAAAEILDSRLPAIDANRAGRMAEWMRTGRR